MRPINKQDLIFDWKEVESHAGWKWAAVFIVFIGFLLSISVCNIRFNTRETSVEKVASVMFFPDNEIGLQWRLRAEEEGPFPGRLEIDGFREPLDWVGFGALGGGGSWNNHVITMRPMEVVEDDSANRVAVQGQRYFPSRIKNKETAAKLKIAEVSMVPALFPYSQEAVKWLPDELPLFRMQADQQMTSASWRFVLSLRANGTVDQCLSLSGGREDSLRAMIDWLEDLRFKSSNDELRWVGLRVEFLNKRSDGADPK